MTRVDTIQWFIDFINAETYLEIGVRNGDSFFPVECRNKIGVDIEIPFDVRGRPETFYEMSSNDFFLLHPHWFDVAFIDGDHTYKQSLSDALNCLKWMNKNGVILLHDCNPTTEEMAAPELIYGFPDWCGEVWKTILTLRTDPSLSVHVVDEDYGMGIVMKRGQEPLSYSREQIEKMTYKDLDENRELFLNLVKHV